MRTMLQLLLGAVLAEGLSTTANATPFDLKFDVGGADCANDLGAINCNTQDILDTDGDLHFDIGGGVELVVTAYEVVDVMDLSMSTLGDALQDYPAEGGLAVNGPNTDQVEPGQGLFFDQTNAMAFIPRVHFNDDHGPIDPARSIGVAWYIDGVYQGDGDYSASDLAGGILGTMAFPDINGWLFFNRDTTDWTIGGMSPVPEPGTALLLGMGVVGLAARRRTAAHA